MRIVAITLAAVAALLLVLLAGLAWHYSSVLVHPPRPTLADPTAGGALVRLGAHRDRDAASPADLGLAYEDVSFVGGEGLTVRGWYIPGREADERVVVFAHGNASNRRFGLDYASLLHGRGFHLLLIDLSGRGDSDGDVVTYGVRESQDLVRAAAFARTLPRLERARVALWGISMGAASAILAAASDPTIRAVVADSSFASFGDAIRDGAARMGLPRVPSVPILRALIRLRGGYDIEAIVPEEAARRLAAPLLLLHGTADHEIDAAHSERIRAAAGARAQLILMPGLGHNDPRPPEIAARAADFLESSLAAPSGAE